MKKRILMVYPEFPTTYWSLKHALKFVGKKTATIPLGLLTVAALLPGDYSLKLIDMNVEKLDPADVRGADLVLLSAMIVQKTSFEEVVALCNREGVPVVAGGPYPTSSYGSITGVDHFVLNEAEVTLPPFIRDYEAGHPKRLYLDEEKPDIVKTPPPRFDLIDFRNYNNVALQNSRGCPFNCEFCDIIQLFGRVPRFKEPRQFIHEMALVYKQGFRGSLFVVDDNFIGNRKKVKELLRGIIDWQREKDYPFTLFTEASVNLAEDDELLDLMVEAGFDMVFVGIETPDAESLKSCSKSQNLKADLFASVHKIQRAGIEVTGGFIVGFDNDTGDIFDRQIEFIQNAGIPMAMIGILGAIPKTRLYNRLKREGRLKEDYGFSGNNTHELQMSFVPVMPERTIIEGYKKIISVIYSPKKYFERSYTLLSRLPTQRLKSARKICWSDIRALFLSLLKQTFSGYSFPYLRFLARVILYRTRYFPQAVALAVKGHHFFIITKDILKADDLAFQLQEAKRMVKDALDKLEAHPVRGAFGPVKSLKLLVAYRKKLERRYYHLSRDVQFYLRDQFEEYTEAFNTFLACIGDVYQYGAQG